MISDNNSSSNKSKPESILTNVGKKYSFSSITTPTSILSPTSSFYASNSNTTGLDLSDLKEKDADVKAWINKMLSSNTFPTSKPSDTNLVSDISPAVLTSPTSATNNTPTDNNIPQQASILLIKLENAGQQISKSIEKISNEVVKNIPRVIYDIENIRKDTRAMQENINRVRMDYRKFNTDSSEVIQPMFLLDTIRLRMEETRKLLKEAENWSNLSSEMDDLFNNKEYERAAVTLEDAQNSLTLLKNSSDYEEKHELLRKYLNRLEAELSPLLLQTIKSKDIKNLRKYQKIFKKINREKEFYNYSDQQEVAVPITPVTPTSPNKEENEAEKPEENVNNVLIIKSTNPQDLSFAEWVPSYFEELYSIIVKEFNWSANIFQQPGDIVCHLINESNKYLKPPFTSRLESYKEIDKEHFIVSLINIYKTVENFAQTIEHNILFQRDTNRFLRMSSFSSLSSSKKSNTLSRFNKNYNLGNWGETLLEPFQTYQQDFAKLELNYLIFQLKQLFKPEVMAHKSPNELVDHLHLTVDKIFDQLKGTMNRCIEFTYGYACPGTLKIINDYLVASLEKYSDIIRVIRTRTEIKSLKKIKEEHKSGINSPLASTTSLNYMNSNGGGGGASANLSRGSLVEMPNDSDEDLLQERNHQIWVNFELGFKLLGICCLFDKEIKQMEGPQLGQFFDRIFKNCESVDETQRLLGQLHTLLTLNHADSEYDLDADSPLETKNTQKLFNSNGESGEDPTDATDLTEDHTVTSKPDNSLNEENLSQNQGHNQGQDQNQGQEPTQTSITPIPEETVEDPVLVQKRLQKSQKEYSFFQKLYQPPHSGSVLSREMIRLSSLNSYELKEFTTEKPSTSISTSTPTSTSATTVVDINKLELLPMDRIHSTILNNVKMRMSRMTNECQRFIYDALFLTIDEQLTDIYHRERWSHAASALSKISPFNFEIPQFSLSPSSYIVSIGEHLLSLPQHLELYLNDEALTYSVNTLPYCQPLSLLTYSLLEELGITPSTRASDDPFHPQEAEDSEFEEPSGHMWIVSLCNGTMVKYIKNIMKLKELTTQESKQLGTDIGYLMNVFGALEIYVLPILISLHSFSQMKDKELLERKNELEAILDKQYNLDSSKSSKEELPSDKTEKEKEKEKEQLVSTSSSMMMLSLTEHEEYELIKLFIKIRNIN
ncbi:hypothetical protein LY90DRAFT_513367 [Neocallimastix californiae]|uniref:Conserved oligomeric Golgi complex subunit 7 n=1 Tax=Neocallimastix californiae TaxID=1754190 RepID=A0A1Y2AZP9_9FUNG|nr:hypothetical protein LY90DRAFT_513367 [Neocallimastix californiae]|eukprot:ORY27717.1 hypothetical protein LY90DRAFT_513367 [Neocallimastix californiae]